MRKLLATVLLCAGCAQYGQTVTTTGLDKEGKSVVTGEVKTKSDCYGVGCDARELSQLELRRQEVADAGAVAKIAVAKGMPTTLGQDKQRSDTQAGYQYGSYGMGGAYGAYGNPYGVSPLLMQADAASRGYMPVGNLPMLGQAPVYVQPQQPQVVQSQPAQATGGNVKCPSNPKTPEERLACLEQDQALMGKKVMALKHK